MSNSKSMQTCTNRVSEMRNAFKQDWTETDVAAGTAKIVMEIKRGRMWARLPFRSRLHLKIARC
jgi:hypothetical protein